MNNNTIALPPLNITPKIESSIVKPSNIDNTLDIHHQNTNHLANTLPPLPILPNQTQPNPNTSNVLLTNSYVQELPDAPQETQNQDQRLPQLTPPPAPTTTNPVDPSKSSNLQPVNLNLLNQKEEVQIPLLNTPFDGTHPLTTVPTDTPNNITNKHTYTPPVYTNKFVAPINNTPILLENLLTSSKTGKTIEGIVTLEDGRKVVSKQKCIYSTKNPDLNPTPLATVTIYATPGYFSSTKQKYPFLDINSDEEINNKINDYLTQFNSNSNFNSNSIHLFKDKTDIDGNKKSVYGMLILQGGTPYIIGYGDRKLACKYADKLKKREDWVVLSNRTGVENAIDRLLKKNPKNTHFGKILDEFDEFTKSRVDIAAPKIGNTLNLHPEAFYNEFNSWLELRERANQNLAPETNKKQDPSVRQKLPPIESKFKPQPMPEVLPVDVQWKSALRSVVYGESSIGGFTLPPDRNPAKRKMVVTKNCIYNTVSQDIHMELPYGAFVYSVSEDTIEKSGFSRAVKRIHVIRPDGPEFVICSGKLGDNMIHEDGELYFPVSSTPKLSKTAAMITNNSMIKNNVDILLESLDEIDDNKMVSEVRRLMRAFMQFLNSKSEETGSLVHPEVFYEEFNEWLGNQALE